MGVYGDFIYAVLAIHRLGTMPERAISRLRKKMGTEMPAADVAANAHLHGREPANAASLMRHEVVASLGTEFAGEGDILDVGCGWGEVAAIIRRNLPQARIALADAYEECLDVASAQVGGRVRTFLLDEHRFNIDEVVPGTYDCIILSHVLEHLRDPIAAIHALCRRLKSNGVIVLAVPNLSRPEVLVSNIFRRDTANRGHVCGWDPSHFRNFLANILGLQIVRLSTDFVGLLPGPPGRLISRTIGRPLAAILPWWGWSTIAIVRPSVEFETDGGASTKDPRLTWRQDA